MNKKQILSFALASAIVAGTPAVSASADFKNGLPAYVDSLADEDSYTVQLGDNLGYISTLYFGTPKYYSELAEYNHIQNPALIYEGQIIRIPEDMKSLFVSTHPRIYAPDEVYTVKEGDYLSTIVKEKYGSDNLVDSNKLATYNDLIDPNIIKEGQVLWLPEKDKLDIVEPRDYTVQYLMLDWRINHPGEPYPDCYIEAFFEYLDEYYDIDYEDECCKEYLSRPLKKECEKVFILRP